MSTTILIISILSSNRFAYKDEYEKFKLVLTVILFVFSFTCRFLLSYRYDFSHLIIVLFLLSWFS